MERYSEYKDSGVQWLEEIMHDINVLESETDGLWAEILE